MKPSEGKISVPFLQLSYATDVHESETFVTNNKVFTEWDVSIADANLHFLPFFNDYLHTFIRKRKPVELYLPGLCP